MSVRPRAIKWLKSHFGINSPFTYTSKYYPPEQSWTKRDAWWVEVPSAAIGSPHSAKIHLVLEAGPDATSFHYLCVPARFLESQLANLVIRGDRKKKKVSLWLSARPQEIFIEQRGKANVAFSQFLRH